MNNELAIPLASRTSVTVSGDLAMQGGGLVLRVRPTRVQDVTTHPVDHEVRAVAPVSASFVDHDVAVVAPVSASLRGEGLHAAFTAVVVFVVVTVLLIAVVWWVP